MTGESLQPPGDDVRQKQLKPAAQQRQKPLPSCTDSCCGTLGREKRLGYRVTERTDSEKARDDFLADPGSFDLLISDMTMPHLTGADLTREVMKIRPDLPVILCTGFSEFIDEAKARELGIKALIMKPVQLDDLAHTVRKVLDGEA